MIRLYRARFSTNVERVALALAHKSLEVESVWISYSDRSAVERVSGQALVPVVEFDDGSVVSDSMQIVRVLEERVPAAQPDIARIGVLAAEMAAALDRFESMLDGRAYLLGDEFSAADCAAYPFLKYALWRDPADDELFHRVLDSYQRLGEDHPRLTAWIERVGERPRV